MTHPTIPAAEHAHSGGSAGGPGENSASCVCGVTFDGFDTHREAVAQVGQHIRDEQETKRADQLAAGDWIAAGPYSERIDGTDDAEVVHVHEYSPALFAALIQEHTITEPVVIYLHGTQTVPLLSAAEVADIRQARRRDELVAQLRGIADLVQMNELRIPEQWGAVLHVDFGGDADAVAEVAKALRVDLLTPGTQTEAVWPADASYIEQVLVSWSARTPKVPAVPVGMDYSRVDDDPQVIRPHSPRVPPHTGAVVDGGVLVDETPTELATEAAKLTVHYRYADHPTACGLTADEMDPALEADALFGITCQDCRDALNAAR